MGDGTIQIFPSTLEGGSSVTSKNGGTTDDLTNTLMGNFNTFLNLLSPLAGEPIVGTGATALMGALDQSGVGLAGTLACFGTGLKILAPAMTTTAHSFITLDGSLATTFHELESLLPQVENYATDIKLVAPTTAQITALKSYVDAGTSGQKVTIPTTDVSIKIDPPHQGGFMGWLHDNQWAAWTAVGVITVAGVGLTLFTAGGSDVVAAGADAAILGTDAAVVVTADTAVVATDLTLVTTIEGTEVFMTDAAITAWSDQGLAALDEYLASLTGAGVG
jgi:hypothetical protein